MSQNLLRPLWMAPKFKRSYAYNVAQEALVGPPPPDFGPEMIYDVSAER